MSIEEAILTNLHALPPDDRRRVLEFSESLKGSAEPPATPRSGHGLLDDLNVHVTQEEISEIRREMWHDFPRDDIP